MDVHYQEGLRERKDYELLELLEGLVDRHGIEEVILYLGGVCETKAVHTKNVWRDGPEAAWWADRSHKLWSI